MTIELISIQPRAIGTDLVPTVNARDLHVFLSISRDFNQWMREQIERARLVEGRHYLPYENVVQFPSGAKHRKEYALTLDAGKHIAMLSGSEKGFEVREYFIDCERRVLAAAQAPRIPSHAADRMVAASRCFNALLRSGQAARMPLPTVIRRAAAVAMRETGIDLLDELQAHDHVALLESDRRLGQNDFPPADLHPSVTAFWQEWSAGEVEGLPCHTCSGADAYAAYQHWCLLRGEANTARREVFTRPIVATARQSGHPAEIRAVRIGKADHATTTRVLLLDVAPADIPISEWATTLVRRFDRHLVEYRRLRRV